MSGHNPSGPVIALVGNPNVGKSTLFNQLTGLHQHTGNWPGKTVSSARGTYTYRGITYTLVDLPGTYSLHPGSAEEEVTRDYLISNQADITLVVLDATCLQRNLALALQVLDITWPVVVCVNLLDEAARKQIQVDLPALEKLLGCPVIGTAARSGRGLDALHDLLAATLAAPPQPKNHICCPRDSCNEHCASAYIQNASVLADKVVHMDEDRAHRRDRLLDRLLTHKVGGLTVMILLLGLILWLTMAGANFPSRLLSGLLFSWQEPLRSLLLRFSAPGWLTGALVDGVYRTVAWVVSVMLPPMAIFFPLFTLLEDAGYLPRVAFNLDHFFCRSGAHGRQALTMCMGLGCNACGVTGCRIIQSPRERLIAIVTNSLVPCNGRFPTLMALIAMFFAAGDGPWNALLAALLLLGVIVLSVAVTLWASRLLSCTALKGEASFFSLELPPYRMPRIGQVLVRSMLDRTVFVLGRAVAVAAPAGLLIWCAANITIGERSVLLHLAGFLEPIGHLLGLDGIILLAFLLGFPAGEIILPAILMGYLSTGALTEYESLAQLHGVLTANGWTRATALSVLLLTLFHLPCGTTCFTIRRETGSVKWTALAMALPCAIGIGACLLVRLLSYVF